MLAALFLAQIPFAYNRFRTGKLSEKINQLEAQRTDSSNRDFNDYRGVIHVHTSLGGHSTGSFDKLLDGARNNKLDFVVMTEHTAEDYDTSALTLNGFYGKTLFIGGNELNTGDGNRFLLIDGSADTFQINKQNTAEFLHKTHASGKIALVTYPEKFRSWETAFDGIEVFSLHTNAKQMNPVFFLFDFLWSYGAYPELTLANYFARPAANLKKFDELAAKRKLTLFAGSDAHSNLGFHLFGDDSGNKLISFKFDDYETIFRTVRTHILLEKDKSLTRENLIEALKNGRAFIGLDILSDTGGFFFTAENAAESKIMGDDINLADGVKLRADAPQSARFILFKNGAKIFEEDNNTGIVFEAEEAGAYRVEVYLDALGSPFDKMPWIISNPIYVR